jgi:ATP-dependent RNA helicase DeaD
MKKSKLTENIKKVFENDDWKKYSDIAKNLLAEVEPEKVVASLLNIFYKNELDPKNYKDIQKVSSIDTT